VGSELNDAERTIQAVSIGMDIVALRDNSGSFAFADAASREVLRKVVQSLKPKDWVAFLGFDRSVQQLIPPIEIVDESSIRFLLDQIARLPRVKGQRTLYRPAFEYADELLTGRASSQRIPVILVLTDKEGTDLGKNVPKELNKIDIELSSLPKQYSKYFVLGLVYQRKNNANASRKTAVLKVFNVPPDFGAKLLQGQKLNLIEMLNRIRTEYTRRLRAAHESTLPTLEGEGDNNAMLILLVIVLIAIPAFLYLRKRGMPAPLSRLVALIRSQPSDEEEGRETALSGDIRPQGFEQDFETEEQFEPEEPEHPEPHQLPLLLAIQDRTSYETHFEPIRLIPDRSITIGPGIEADIHTPTEEIGFKLRLITGKDDKKGLILEPLLSSVNIRNPSEVAFKEVPPGKKIQVFLSTEVDLGTHLVRITRPRKSPDGLF